jgi:hypothetical protein
MDFNPRIPVTINGKPCVLAFDMMAVATLAEHFGISMTDLARLQRQKPDEKKNYSLAMKLLYAMTRSMDDPPNEKDIQRMSVTELMLIEPAIKRAMLAATAPLGENAAAGPVRPEASESASNGGARLPRRSTASKSPRRSSGH